MPVQINEVIIRAVVDNGSSTAPASTTPGITTGQAVPAAEIAALVLEIVKEKNER